MKIKESKSIIIESDNAPLKISGRDGLSAYRVAKFHEKDNKNIKHAVYRTPGGAYYNRYYVKDIYGDEDELGNKGVVGPFTSEEDAVARLKDYKKDVVKESYRGRRRIRESKELDRKAFVSLVKLGRDPYDGYSILNDGYFVKRIYAESDEDAIRQFRDYLARKNEGIGDNFATTYDAGGTVKRYVDDIVNGVFELDTPNPQTNMFIECLEALDRMGVVMPCEWEDVTKDILRDELKKVSLRRLLDIDYKLGKIFKRPFILGESLKEDTGSRGLRFVDNRKNAILGRGEDPGFDEYDCVDDECTYKTRKQANRYPVRKKQR